MLDLSFAVSNLHLLISLPLTREVARHSRDGGREKIINLTIIFITVPWDAEDNVTYNLLKTRQIKNGGSKPPPYRYSKQLAVKSAPS